MPPPVDPSRLDDYLKEQEAAKQVELEKQRQEFNKTNDHMEPNYFLSLIKNIGWKVNNIFSPEDKADIMRNVLIDNDEATLLTTTGTTKDNADERNKGMWRKLNSAITGKKGDTLEHYFENIYKKLACCTNQKTITVPILKRNSQGKIQKIYKTISVDTGNECTMNGINWFDDNTTEQGYNSNCEDLMQRLIAFLSKYDPENDMIKTYGGCLANKNLDDIDEDILKDPFLLNMVNVNRSCLMPSCNQPGAYKRKQDRKSCTTTICTAEFNVSDNQAGGALSVFGNQIQQQCGPQSDLSKSLEKGEDKAQEIIKEKEEKLDKEIEEAKKEIEAKKVIAEEQEEVQAIESSADDFVEQLQTFFNNFFQSFFGLFQGTQETFINFNLLNQMKIPQINYTNLIFYLIIFVIIPIILLMSIKL